MDMTICDNRCYVGTFGLIIKVHHCAIYGLLNLNLEDFGVFIFILIKPYVDQRPVPVQLKNC